LSNVGYDCGFSGRKLHIASLWNGIEQEWMMGTENLSQAFLHGKVTKNGNEYMEWLIL